MTTRLKLVFNRANQLFKLVFTRHSEEASVDKTHSVITQIGGINNVQNVKAGGKVTVVGNKNNVQNVQAGDDIVIVATQIGGKNNVQRIE